MTNSNKKEKMSNLPPEVAELMQHIGDLMKHWGFKKIHGEIWSCLFLSDKPLDAAAIIERLGISKSLVSMSMSDLTEMNLVVQDGKSSEGTLLYKANTNISEVIFNILRFRERKIFAKLSSSYSLVETLPEGETKKWDLNMDRIKDFGNFLKEAESVMGKLVTKKVS